MGGGGLPWSLVIVCMVVGARDSGFNVSLIKKPWAFIGVPCMNPTILGLWAQGSLIRFLHNLYSDMH